MHWLEDYAFGAVALREEMNNRKVNKPTKKNFVSDVILRLLYIYAIAVVILVAPYYLSIQLFNMLWFKIKKFFSKSS